MEKFKFTNSQDTEIKKFLYEHKKATEQAEIILKALTNFHMKDERLTNRNQKGNSFSFTFGNLDFEVTMELEYQKLDPIGYWIKTINTYLILKNESVNKKESLFKYYIYQRSGDIMLHQEVSPDMIVQEYPYIDLESFPKMWFNHLIFALITQAKKGIIIIDM